MITVPAEYVTTLRSDLCYHKPVCRLSSVVCNVRAPNSGVKYFFAILYLSHPLTAVQNFTKIVPGEPLRRRR